MPMKILDTPLWGPLRMCEAAARAGLNPNTLQKRIAKGYPIEQALAPVVSRKKVRPQLTKAERMARKTYKLTPDERIKLVNMYVQGLKCEYIAAVLGIRRESVSKMALRAGVPYRRGPRVQSVSVV